MFKKLWRKIKLFFMRKKSQKKEKFPELPELNPLKHLEIAMNEIGVKEVPGSKHNKKIIDYHKSTGSFDADETPWCASFVNWCLEESGIMGTKSAMARSFLKFGKPVNKPKRGDIVVLWRKSKSSSYGHVGFYMSETEREIHILGGNQNDAVNIKAYDKTGFLVIEVSKRNKELAKQYYTKNCTACGKYGCDPDHISNYSGCGKRDIDFNIWPLCRKHHTEKGSIGLTEFAKKYKLDDILVERGYWHNGHKWLHPKLAK